LCWLTILNAERDKQGALVETTLLVLFVFNAGLALFLGLGAYYGVISWLGLIVHLPLALLCLLALFTIKKGSK